MDRAAHAQVLAERLKALGRAPAFDQFLADRLKDGSAPAEDKQTQQSSASNGKAELAADFGAASILSKLESLTPMLEKDEEKPQAQTPSHEMDSHEMDSHEVDSPEMDSNEQSSYGKRMDKQMPQPSARLIRPVAATAYSKAGGLLRLQAPTPCMEKGSAGKGKDKGIKGKWNADQSIRTPSMLLQPGSRPPSKEPGSLTPVIRAPTRPTPIGKAPTVAIPLLKPRTVQPPTQEKSYPKQWESQSSSSAADAELAIYDQAPISVEERQQLSRKRLEEYRLEEQRLAEEERVKAGGPTQAEIKEYFERWDLSQEARKVFFELTPDKQKRVMEDFAPTNSQTRLKCSSAEELGRDAGGKFVMFCRSVQKYDKKPDPPPPQTLGLAEQMALVLHYQYAAQAAYDNATDEVAQAAAKQQLAQLQQTMSHLTTLHQLQQVQQLEQVAFGALNPSELKQLPEEEDAQTAKRHRTN